MKKIILILSVFTALTAGVYLFIRFNIFTTSLKYLAQSQLTVALSRPVKIEKVVWLPFNKIVLKKIQFEGFNCEEAVVAVNLKKISKGLSSIESITLINPQVNISAVKNTRIKKSKKKSAFLLPAKISVLNGTVTFSSTFTVNNFNLETVNKNNNYAVKSKAVVITHDKNNFSSQIEVAGMINNDSSVKLKGTLGNTNFNNLEKLNGDFNIRGSNGNFNLSGKLNSAEINLKIDTNIILDNLKINSQVSGNINNLRKFAEHLLPGTTFQYLPENAASFDGSYQLPDKKLTLNIKQNDMKIANIISLRNVRTDLIIFNNECIVNSTATALNGDVILTGKIQKNNLDLSITFRDMEIQSDYVSATCALDLKILGTFDNPKIAGKITTDNLSLKNKSSKNVSGRVLWENGKGSVKMSGSNFALNIEGNKSKITRGNIKYDTTEILFSGKYDKINFHCKNVDVSMFDNNISGFIGYIDGYIKNGAGGDGVSHPEIAASFSSDNITINESTTSITGEFFYDREGMYIKNLKTDGLNGEIKIKKNTTEGSSIRETSGYLNLSKCNSNIILPFVGIGSDVISGNISGKINWNSKNGNPKPHGIIAITRGKLFKNIPYDLIVTSFETKLSKLIITEFAVQQKASKTSIRLSGEIDKNRFNLNLKLDEFEISGKTINGNLELTGEKLAENFIQFNITSDKLAIDKITEKLSAYGSYDGKKIDIKKIKWGDKISGTAGYFISSKYLSSDIDFRFDAENLNKNLQGPLVGKITVRGNINSPQVLAGYYFDGRIYEKAANGYGKLLINHDLLKVEESKLSVDGATAEISGIIDLNKKEFSGLNISLSNLKTQTIYDLLKSTYLLSGTWKTIELNIFGDLKDPQITADFFGKNMRVENKTVDAISGKCSLKSKKILFSKGDIKWSLTNIKILPDTYIDFSKDVVFRIIAEIRNLKFPGITLFGGIDADGRLDKDTVKADISTAGLWINQKQLKNSKHYIEYSKGIMRFIPEMGKSTQITGTVDFSKPSEFSINNFSIFELGKRLFYLNGSLVNDNIDLTAEGENISIGDLLNLFDIKITAEGNTDFNLKATGKSQEPTITCLLSSANGKIENLGFDIASVFFQLKENILDLKHLKLSRAKLYSFEGEGTTPLPLTDAARKKLANYPIDISLKVADGDLAILPSLTKSVKKAKGNFSTNVDIRGTLNKPDVKGTFTAKADEIQLNNIFKKITDAKCEINFNGKIIKLKQLDALIDKEPISINGEMAIADGFNPGNFNFQLLTPQKDIPVTINDLNIKSGGAALSNPSKAKIKTDIKFFGTPDNWNIDGYMKISNARFTYPGKGSEEGSWDFLKNANWNLKIIAGKDCWYERNFASVEAKGELLLHGKGSSPLVTGRVEALRGELDYLGRNFTIIEAIFEAEKSNLFLSGRAEADTEIQIQREDFVNHEMKPEYVTDTIIITIPRGPLEEVKPRFSSKTNPQMDEQTAARAAMGMQSTGQAQPLTAEDMSKRIDTFLTTPFVKSILKKTGFIDSFAIKRESTSTPQPSGVQPSVLGLYKGAQLQIGKEFTRGFSADYGVKFDEFENKLSLKHEIELSYRLKNGIMFRTSQEIEKNESGESKFFFEKWWRFGTEGEKK
ncbi:MAG: hypothetical protein COS68_01800 [Elusimicrobia bacterium CG06_land_8_20_14_3_00_38_11]|nr:MAG: hypothetical protein COS68_01800 [Elusimicrobia bacterium CG06_land_8_20_14_3_00_38_11]